MGIVLLVGAPIALLWYSYALRNSLEQLDLYDISCAIGFLVVIAITCKYFFSWGEVTEAKIKIILAEHYIEGNDKINVSETKQQVKREIKEKKKKIAKVYWVVATWSILCMTTLSMASKSVYFICHKQNRILVWTATLVLLVITVLWGRIVLKKIKQLLGEKKKENNRISYTRIMYPYCHKCGTRMASAGEFCGRCGEDVVRTVYQERDDEYYRKWIKSNAGEKMQFIAKVLCLFAVVTFFVFFWHTNPSVGRLFFMIIITVVMVAVFFSQAKKTNAKGLYSTVIALSVFVIMMTIGLLVKYESKVDFVMADAPPNNHIRVLLQMDIETYIDGMKIYSDTDTYVDFGYIYCRNEGEGWIELDTEHQVECYWKYGVGEVFTHYDTVTITSDNIDKPMVFVEKIEVEPDTYQLLTITLTRKCTFWEVIFY